MSEEIDDGFGHARLSDSVEIELTPGLEASIDTRNCSIHSRRSPPDSGSVCGFPCALSAGSNKIESRLDGYPAATAEHTFESIEDRDASTTARTSRRMDWVLQRFSPKRRASREGETFRLESGSAHKHSGCRMGLVNWFKGLFGGSAEASAKAPAAIPPSAKSSMTPLPNRVSAMPPARESVRSSVRTPTPLVSSFVEDPVRIQWDRLKTFVARCDREDLDLAGLHIEDAITFWGRHARIERAKLDNVGAEQAVKAEGFSCLDHWSVVSRYFQARYSELVKLPDGKLAIRYVDAFQRACEQAERDVAEERARREREAALFEPISGVTLERFAEIAAAMAHLGAEATRTRTTELLAAYGLGTATFGAVRRGWESRMEGDTSKKLRRTYRQHWTHARELLTKGEWQIPGANTERQEVSGVSTRYTWVESVETRPEYRSAG